ncbi:hypothetical protein BGX38DRAFT_145318 [Terfezia claveryi]|nr:hypothetical protein BGX38DRAFT_145318 [Terfezia claveryi]
MPNFMWPPPFLPPPIPIQPPPVAMPDLHFFPIPPHPGMAVVCAPVPLPMPMQTTELTSAAVPLAPTLTPARQHKPIETGYHTMTTTTFIPVGTLAETCYQKLDKPMVKDKETHSIVTNNPLNTSEKPPAAEPGKKPEKSTPPAPIPIHPQAPVQKKQREERYYHHHTHCYTNPAVRYDRAGRKGVSSPSTKEEECNSGHIKTQEKQKESEVTKGPENCEAPTELKALEKEGETKVYSSESNHLISEAVKANDNHHHYYYTQGAAYAFPSPISAQANLASHTEYQTTLQTLAEMQDAIRNLQLAQAALTSRVTEVDHEVQSPPSESQISPENVQHGPELDAGFHITAAGCENAKPEKPKATSPEATPPVQSTNPTNEPAQPTLPESRYRVPCPHGCAPFPHEDLGPPLYMQFPRPFGGLPPHQPGFNYSATYQAAGGNSPGYPYTQGGTYRGIPMNPNNRVRRSPRRKSGHKRTYGESEDSSSEGESYYTRASRSASVGENRSRGHHTGE